MDTQGASRKVTRRGEKKKVPKCTNTNLDGSFASEIIKGTTQNAKVDVPKNTQRKYSLHFVPFCPNKSLFLTLPFEAKKPD